MAALSGTDKFDIRLPLLKGTTLSQGYKSPDWMLRHSKPGDRPDQEPVPVRLRVLEVPPACLDEVRLHRDRSFDEQLPVP